MNFDPCAPGQAGQSGANAIKGSPIVVLTHAARDGLSDVALYCGPYNAVSVEVLVSGANASADVSVEGSSSQGGNYLPLPDPNARQLAVTSSRNFDCVVGSAWVKVRLSAVSGSFAYGLGFTVTVTPYVSPGQTRITVDVDAEPSGSGEYTPSSANPVGVATASTQVLAANPSREFASFVNDSDTVVYLGIGTAAVLNAGIRLNAKGGSYVMSRKLGNLVTQAVYAIHGGAGTKNLAVTEGT